MIEVLDVLAVLLFRLSIGFCHAHDLKERGAIGVGILASGGCSRPEPIHDVVGRLAAEVAKIGVRQIAVMAIIPGR